MSATPLRQRILVPLLFGGAGFLANLFRFEIFFNVDFIFGSVFVMLAILLAGPVSGVVAALIAGSATVVLWNHPWALVIAAAEAACVGWLVRRRSWDLLLADLLYWIILGAPLVWLLYHYALQTQAQTALLIFLKQAVNGIVNTLLASLLHKIWRARFRPEEGTRPAFRPTVFVTLVSLVTFPALLFLAAFLRREIRQEEQVLVRRSVELDRVTRRAINDWIEDRHQGVATLAALVARPDISAVDRQRAVEVIRAATPAFMRVGVQDAQASVIAFSPLIDEDGRSAIGRNFSDRPYLPILKETLHPYVSDPVMGRIGHPTPMLPLLVPIVRDGRYDGYCIGVTNTDHLRGLLDSIVGTGNSHLTILGRNGQIVASTQKDRAVMSVFRTPPGDLRPLAEGVWQRIPPSRPGSSVMQRWRQSFIVHEGVLSPALPWKVVVELPLAPLIDALTRISILGLGTLLLLILGTVALAKGLSRGFTESIAQLEGATRAFPLLLREEPGEPLPLPSSGIEELHRLATHFQEMEDALRTSFQELSALKDSLELRVATRTRELQTALDTIKTLQGIIPICASCKKIRDDKGAWNQLESYISEHTDAAFTHGICPECAKRLYPEYRRGDPEP